MVISMDNFFNYSFDNISNKSKSFNSIESFEIPNIINDSFNTVARIFDNSNTTFQTPTLDIIDESSNTSKSIWDYFNKVKKNNKVIAKCKHCKILNIVLLMVQLPIYGTSQKNA
ncbi:hypothetical protein F8M41_014879 [Gigaspora margarita]|uniref:Uncharacterized protein n=1 Tax=Gigaspora margarita TaxID=4874 RepID=A0A8H3ZZL9_GIGMA|nr:hypothetical protein F8M41_014879 [Gigaspora margarita]